ncbi:hypothetical protein [uncultured Tessaracoccus sp.]|uniref:hypothetical protein n=1 Tax=uncultured Tessaracoccus sp. TaxID=905023 RepID=UPI0026258D15|nr:hypothetical protein [uncultured Tessaracoccus sp.]
MRERPPLDAELLDFHAKAASFDGSIAVQYDDGTVVVITLSGPEVGPKTARIVGTKGFNIKTLHIDEFPELGDLAVAAHTRRPVGAYKLPPGKLITMFNPAYVLSMLAGLSAGGLFGLWASYHMGVSIPPLVFIMVVLCALVPVALIHPHFVAAPHVYLSGGHEYQLHGFLDDAGARKDIVGKVNALKADYGRLASDVITRIEYPALFDATLPETRRFTELMVRWDAEHTRLSNPERATLAGELAVAFEAVKAHAEAVGMQHYPDDARGPADTALKAMRLAQDSRATRAERQAALERAVAILESLALHYLPTVREAKELVAGRPLRALPGRLEL